MSEQVYCAAHLARTGEKVRASHRVGDEPMCSACFAGKPLFVPKPRRKRAARVQSAPLEPSSLAPSTLSPRTRFILSL